LIQLQNITKRFPGVLANDRLSLTLSGGEIHTLLGENGAGKSTLLNILSGMLQPDKGQIMVRGREVKLTSPHEALRQGIGTVYQHFTLVPTLSVLENIVLGAATGFRLDLRWAEQRLQALLGDFGLPVSPGVEVQHLSLGQQQRVEIIKALYRGSQVLLLDEPTSVLTPPEVQDLFALLHSLKAKGVAIVFISHKLDEALAISDRITVLRQGRQVGHLKPEDLRRDSRKISTGRIVKLMFGEESSQVLDSSFDPSLRNSVSQRNWVSKRSLDTSYENRVEALAETPSQRSAEASTPTTSIYEGELDRLSSLPQHAKREKAVPLCTLEHVSARSDRGTLAVQEVNLTLHAGEIFGLAGVDGNGQKELAEVMAGQRRAAGGQIMVAGVDVTNRGVAAVEQAGLGYVTDERLTEGTVPVLSVAENLVLKGFRRPPFSWGIVLNRTAIAANAEHLMAQFKIKAANLGVRTGTLSGGNVQKLLLARELAAAPKVLVCSQPTQGLDAVTTQFVLQTLRAQAEQGAAILVISSELEELLALSDRLGVMYNGRLREVSPSERANREKIGRLMLGAAA
jgi:simple sugar transport system ATP-binding protein